MTAQELNTVYENKCRFVEKLGEALKTVDRFDIADIKYARIENDEIVEITFNCGFKRYLNVTGDSEYAIISDIHRALG